MHQSLPPVNKPTKPLRWGAVFPTTEIGNDPAAIRDWAQAAESLGYSRIVAFDHVLGAQRAGREALLAHLPYDESTPFHEPFVLFGYLAAVTTRIELATGVLLLSQRQTPLVAKQAAEVDLLSGGRLVLGVGCGGSPVEHESMGYPQQRRFKRLDEQIPLLRRFWNETVVAHEGEFERIDRAGIAPQPQRAIPIWLGGRSDPMYRRAARLCDGFVFGTDGAQSHAGARRIHELLAAEGRDTSAFPLDMYTPYSGGEDHWRTEAATWRELSGTHLTVRTTDASAGVHGYRRHGFTAVRQHIDALEHFMRTVSA